MNAFDEMSEELTTMMITLDNLSGLPRTKPLMKALEKAHVEACKASLVLREELGRIAEHRLRLVQEAGKRALPVAVIGFAALGLADAGHLSTRLV